MNVSYIPLRYAKVLLEFTKMNSSEDEVYRKCKKSAETFQDFRLLRHWLSNPMITAHDRFEMLKTVLKTETDETLNKFIEFLIQQGREQYIQEIILRYIRLYREDKKILNAVLTTAYQVDDKTESEILSLIQSDYSSIELDKKINTDIIGGFILEVENLRVDASISGEIKAVSKALSRLNHKSNY